jgi:hypothetical protein
VSDETIAGIENLWEWLCSLFANWQTLATGGGLGGAVLLLIQLTEWFKWLTLKTSVKIFLVGWCFVIGASFMAWKDERDAINKKTDEYNQLDVIYKALTVTDLHAEIVQMAFGPYGQGNTIVYLFIKVTNKGAPSVAYISNVVVKEADGSTPLLTPVPQYSKDTTLDEMGVYHQKMIFRASQHFQTIMTEKPITRGDAPVGWIAVLVPGPPAQALKPRALATVEILRCRWKTNSNDGVLR